MNRQQLTRMRERINKFQGQGEQLKKEKQQITEMQSQLKTKSHELTDLKEQLTEERRRVFELQNS